jgi:hypothetical protein
MGREAVPYPFYPSAPRISNHGTVSGSQIYSHPVHLPHNLLEYIIFIAYANRHAAVGFAIAHSNNFEIKGLPPRRKVGNLAHYVFIPILGDGAMRYYEDMGGSVVRIKLGANMIKPIDHRARVEHELNSEAVEVHGRWMTVKRKVGVGSGITEAYPDMWGT